MTRSIFQFLSIFLFFCFASLSVSAQSFEEYKRQQQSKFNNYVQKKTEKFRASEKPTMRVIELQYELEEVTDPTPSPSP